MGTWKDFCTQEGPARFHEHWQYLTLQIRTLRCYVVVGLVHLTVHFYCLYHQALLIKNWVTAMTSVLKNKRLNIFSYCRKGDPFQGPRVGSYLTLRKWIVWGDTLADKAENFIGKGCPGGEKQDKGTQEKGFMVMGLVSTLSLASHSDSGSFLVVHISLSQHGFQWEGFWKVGRSYELSSPLSFWLLPNSSGW